MRYVCDNCYHNKRLHGQNNYEILAVVGKGQKIAVVSLQ